MTGGAARGFHTSAPPGSCRSEGRDALDDGVARRVVDDDHRLDGVRNGLPVGAQESELHALTGVRDPEHVERERAPADAEAPLGDLATVFDEAVAGEAGDLLPEVDDGLRPPGEARRADEPREELGDATDETGQEADDEDDDPEPVGGPEGHLVVAREDLGVLLGGLVARHDTGLPALSGGGGAGRDHLEARRKSHRNYLVSWT